MLTYGVYTKDLKGSAIQGVSLDVAREYKYGDRVICSEKQKRCGVTFCLFWHEWIGIRIRKWRIELGFITMSWSWNTYTTADKVIE